MPGYKFTVEECECGHKLSGQKVELEGMKGPIPMGRCPKCGTAHPLEVESSAEAEAKAKAEAEAEAEEKARLEAEAKAKEEAEEKARLEAEE